jgi:hypothetical protein
VRRFVFSPKSSVTMKGGWAGAKVASASEEPGCTRRTPYPRHQPKIRWGAPTPKEGGMGVTGAADRRAQRVFSRAESFPHRGINRGKLAPCRVSTMQNQGPAHAELDCRLATIGQKGEAPTRLFGCLFGRCDAIANTFAPPPSAAPRAARPRPACTRRPSAKRRSARPRTRRARVAGFFGVNESFTSIMNTRCATRCALALHVGKGLWDPARSQSGSCAAVACVTGLRLRGPLTLKSG